MNFSIYYSKESNMKYIKINMYSKEGSTPNWKYAIIHSKGSSTPNRKYAQCCPNRSGRIICCPNQFGRVSLFFFISSLLILSFINDKRFVFGTRYFLWSDKKIFF